MPELADLHPWVAAPAGWLALRVALLINTHVCGFLPDDRPGGRKQHARPTPLAGVVLGAATAAALGIAGHHAFAAAAAACTALGFADDMRKEHGDGVAWWIKALVLAAATALITVALPHQDPGAGTLVLLALLIFATINAVNFLDNTDGVAAVVGGLGLVLGSQGHGVFAVAGFAFLGALPLNWPRARLFLGDAGALTLGATLAAFAASHYTGDPSRARTALAAVAVPLLDFTQVVAARLVIGHPPWVGDRRHMTHILISAGLPRTLVAPVCAALVVGAFAVFADATLPWF